MTWSDERKRVLSEPVATEPEYMPPGPTLALLTPEDHADLHRTKGESA